MKFNTTNYTIEFDSKGQIVSLKKAEKQFISKVLPLLQFKLRNGGEVGEYTSNQADKIEINQIDNRFTFEYGFENLNFSVKAEVVCEERLIWRLNFENKTGKCVEWIDFPQIAVPNDLVANGGSGRLLIDINEGLVLEDMKYKELVQPYKELEYPSEGLYAMFPAVVESQFLAYYDNTCGIYFAAEDAARSIKGVDFAPIGEDAVKLQIRLYPGLNADVTDYNLPFDMVVDFFNGDWYSAAELYRNWFEKNLPENLVSVEENSNLPEWYEDSPLIVTYPVQGIHDMDDPIPNRLFPYNNALPYFDDIYEKTGSRIMAALMHWEGTAMWAPPYVWPPLGGEEMLQNFCEELHKRNFLLGVYCSGTGFTIQSNIKKEYNLTERIEKEGLKKYMCAPPDGGEPRSKICEGQRVSYDMCISEDFTKETLLKEAKSMASCGLDYIQLLDQNHGGTPYFCFSDKHNHPPVPGSWMIEHMTEFLKTLKSALGNKVLIGCESAAAEAYIPYLNLSDNRFNLNYRIGRPVPLYGYLYHKYLHNFSGNSVCSLDIINIHKSPDCHMLRVAHSFLAGDLMTLVINQDGEIVWSWGERDFSVLPEREPILNFVKIATAYRRGTGKKYLVFGEMIKPCDVFSDEVAMHSNFDPAHIINYPAVLTTAFKASDGSKAQFLASYRKQEEVCKIDLSNTKGARLIDENGKVIKELPPKICEITVPCHSVRMLEFC